MYVKGCECSRIFQCSIVVVESCEFFFHCYVLTSFGAKFYARRKKIVLDQQNSFVRYSRKFGEIKQIILVD